MRQWNLAATYALLCCLSALFALPFLWMVSSGFKDLETIFEYPPTLLPLETETELVRGRHFPLGNYTSANGSAERVVILDRRPGETQVAAVGVADSERRWVPNKTVSLRRHIHFRWENFPRAWTSEPFSLYTVNTLIITSLGIIGQAISASLVAFGFARLEWPGRNILFVLLLSTMMLPQEVTMIPSFLIFRQLGWIDTFLPLIVPAYLGGGAFSIFLFRQFFLSLPRELDDAARVDGCGSFGIYLYILMPLCKPIIATIAVFSFVAHWNDFLTPLIYLNSSDKFTLAVGLRFFQGAYGTDMHLLMAASTLALLPVLLVFFVGQKYFVRSIVMSGVKG